ncbi:hypothetical protein SLEP1_g4105 [Rubroshorea leprosula]|uniref:Uncharacterized protein n=1 Tax=Rubroshorea leprosula TaxID=152421 RepID=A0AAV5HTD9_9ROSI|nr:hypothetical protein SLEP1_g4105 [Rubroshorea leprosula]
MSKTSVLSFLLCILLCFISQQCMFTSAAQGSWALLQENIGIAAMHMQLLNNDRVIMFDRTDFGPPNLSLPNGNCRNDPNDRTLKVDCTAHSIEYNVLSNTFRALTVQTDVWCSSGAVMANGMPNGLAAARWYASDHILPDGRMIIVGGRRQFNYEFYPKNTAPGLFSLPFSSETNDRGVENNLYPFVHLNVDGNVFIFANNRAILLDYVNKVVVKTYPMIPGAEARSYPSTGSSVLLPLKNIQAPNVHAEVLICGGGANGSYTQSLKKKFLPALETCARINITDPNPRWVMETMPLRRVMGDMILLPDGSVLIINGAASAGLVRDGRVLVAGSNPHAYYNFTGVLYPTELRLEAFSPEYLNPTFDNIRPTIVAPVNQGILYYGQKQKVRFSCPGPVIQNQVEVALVAPPFVTHSFSQNQRLLVLGNNRIIVLRNNYYDVEATMPPSPILAPSGFYLMYMIHQGIPSQGIWINLKGH